VSKKLFYRIGEACKLLDIQPYVLRYWETEFPVLSPRKSKAGQRVYSEEELRLIQRIKQLLYEEGYTIAGAKKKLESELAGETSLGAETVPSPASRTGKAQRSGDHARVPTSAPPAADDAAFDDQADDASEPDLELEPMAAGEHDGDREDDAPRASSVAAAPAPQLPRPVSRSLDTGGGQQVERLRTGLQEALAEARDILRLLSA
jgi:DNA-binding transcriptional MerR regulator